MELFFFMAYIVLAVILLVMAAYFNNTYFSIAAGCLFLLIGLWAHTEPFTHEYCEWKMVESGPDGNATYYENSLMCQTVTYNVDDDIPGYYKGFLGTLLILLGTFCVVITVKMAERERRQEE